ncbi:MAG TPA: PQQ-binding-like beta-propeller repeat protein, partial [Candidatus Sulfopaludibacter sp.]|nr:PQQ-binding-like beta-propeller repeat protein [Candidatus Sulfopaludibacter sp.]
MVLAVTLASTCVQPGPAQQSLGKATPAKDADWAVYNGGSGGRHYSPLAQINRANVAHLIPVWRYDTGDTGNMETNPIVVHGVLYAYSPTQKVIALNAATGKRIWQFDSGIHGTQPVRGVTYWPGDAAHTPRILAGIMEYLYCLDARTGQPIATFGDHGRIDLRKNLRGNYRQQSTVLTSPGILYKNLIIVGGRDPETHPAPPGDIRAFSVLTGQLVWRFRTIPRPGEPGYTTWPRDAWKTAGAANNWAGMALDEERGIVYVPTGSAVMDFYGGDRVGNDLYANTLLALDANTGRRLWSFQGVHHDLWDRDFPSPPALFSLTRNGAQIPALAQTTKQGYLFVFNRVTGKPLFPIREEPFPRSNVPGEVTSPTQPVPMLPAPYGRQQLTADMLTTRTPAAHEWALKTFDTFRSNGQFVPFVVGQQTIVFPGFDGGAEWGGPAIDPQTDTIYINETEMAWTGGL